ncbi:MAG: SPOCS domain-containing protein [Sedimentibacter sp.]
MFKLFSDTFNINEIIDSSSTEVLLENEFTVQDNLPDIEKIISTEGKIKINNASVKTDTVTVEGNLVYNIIYRSNDEETIVCSMSDKIPFSEDIHVPGATGDMDAQVNAYIDYIDTEPLTSRNSLVKAVLILETDVINNHPVNFVSNLESDGSFQAKTKNIKYTDTVSQLSENANINDAVELNKASDEIARILKAESEIYITNIDALEEKMLVEGICKVGFLYAEDNSLNSTGFISEEFPFTHYIEVKNSGDNMLKDINIVQNEMTYSIAENYDNEKKLIEFNLPFTVNAQLYDTIEKNIIMDCYSTESLLELDSNKVNLSSLKNIMNKTVKFENNLDIANGTIKDIYTVDISPKISEKRLLDDKYLVDGFLDVNILYLNGDINKIDRAYSSLPFTASIDLHEGNSAGTIVSDVKINKCGAYRKGSNSAVVNCDINVALKFLDKDEITVISNITEAGPVDHSKMPSLIFRVVQSGETIWDIAKNYNLSINHLKELNDLPTDNVLNPGTKIIIARKV